MDHSTQPYTDTLQDEKPETFSIYSVLAARDGTGIGDQKSRRQIQLALGEYNLDDLVEMLLEYEQQYETSTLEMFSRYVKGKLDPSGEAAEWLGIFLLFLNSDRVRDLYCR